MIISELLVISFAPVLKTPFHEPKSEKTNFNWPVVPEDEQGHFIISENFVNDTRHKNLVWSDRKGLASFLNNGIKAPFWWNSMLEMIDIVAKTLELDTDDRIGFLNLDQKSTIYMIKVNILCSISYGPYAFEL